MHRARVHRAFGLDFACAFHLPGIPALQAASPTLQIRLAEPAAVQDAWSGPAPSPAVAELVQDGLPYRAERGAAGDHRFSYGDRATFHLSAGGNTLLCAPLDAEAPEWRRVLLDSVLATASLLSGYEALHAAAVLGPDGAVALMGRTGGGKTTLAAELLRRGHPLFCDDVLALSRDGGILAHPAPPVMNLPAGAPAPPGQALAAIGGETWVAVDRAASEPAPVAAVCLIDRRPGARPAVVPGPASPLDLLVHGLRSGNAPGRRQSRFELLSDLAAQTPAYVLEADTRTTAAEMADLLENAVPALARAHAEACR
jgi:hypothetical protein